MAMYMCSTQLLQRYMFCNQDDLIDMDTNEFLDSIRKEHYKLLNDPSYPDYTALGTASVTKVNNISTPDQVENEKNYTKDQWMRQYHCFICASPGHIHTECQANIIPCDIQWRKVNHNYQGHINLQKHKEKQLAKGRNSQTAPSTTPMIKPPQAMAGTRLTGPPNRTPPSLI